MENKEQKKKSFIEVLSDHMKRITEIFSKGTVIDDNKKIAEAGRTEEEKKLLMEMCEEIDGYHRNLKELRESELTPGEWLNKKIDSDLETADPEITKEDKDIVKAFIMDETMQKIEDNSDALSEELDIINNVVNNNEEKEVEKGGMQ